MLYNENKEDGKFKAYLKKLFRIMRGTKMHKECFQLFWSSCDVVKQEQLYLLIYVKSIRRPASK